MKPTVRSLKTKRKLIELRLDKLWRNCILERAGNCSERSGRTYGLQGAHVITRSNKGCRWDLENGVCLTKGEHHFFAHKYPLKFREWLIKYRGQKWLDNLQIKAGCIVKRTITDLLWIEKNLKQELKRLKEEQNDRF